VRIFNRRGPVVQAGVITPQPKTAEAVYLTPDHRAWRKAVIDRAGGRCQAYDNGIRCTRMAPYDRLFADHIVELKDGGSPTDPANGQALCGRHHTIKTNHARVLRLRQ
jgi:5-methylcytosine-specific restriction protein A